MWTVTQCDKVDGVLPWAFIHKTKEEAMQACQEAMQEQADRFDEPFKPTITWLDHTEMANGICHEFELSLYLSKVQFG
jgi:hypothetical protein